MTSIRNKGAKIPNIWSGKVLIWREDHLKVLDFPRNNKRTLAVRFVYFTPGNTNILILFDGSDLRWEPRHMSKWHWIRRGGKGNERVAGYIELLLSQAPQSIFFDLLIKAKYFEIIICYFRSRFYDMWNYLARD